MRIFNTKEVGNAIINILITIFKNYCSTILYDMSRFYSFPIPSSPLSCESKSCFLLFLIWGEPVGGQGKTVCLWRHLQDFMKISFKTGILGWTLETDLRLILAM